MNKRPKRNPFFIEFANAIRGIDLAEKPVDRAVKNIRLAVNNAKKRHPQHKKKWETILNQLDSSPQEVLWYCDLTRDLVFQLAYYKTGWKVRVDQGIVQTLSPMWIKNLNSVLRHTAPILKWQNGRFMLGSTIMKRKHNFLGELVFEIAQFLLNDYREGLVSVCELAGCEAYILTSNGQKYCSRAHTKKASDQKRLMEDEDKAKDRERNRINKQYHRRLKASPGLIKKYPTFKDYLKTYPHGFPPKI